MSNLFVTFYRDTVAVLKNKVEVAVASYVKKTDGNDGTVILHSKSAIFCISVCLDMFSEVKLHQLLSENFEESVIFLYLPVKDKQKLSQLEVGLLFPFKYILIVITLQSLLHVHVYLLIQSGDIFQWKTANLIRKVRRGSREKQSVKRLYHKN